MANIYKVTFENYLNFLFKFQTETITTKENNFNYESS